MKKIIYSFFLIILVLITFSIVYLSTIGVETSKFNNLIINEKKKKNTDFEISLSKIQIKFDLKKIQVYLSTVEPKIVYRDVKIPIKQINIYSKISSIIRSKNEISQATISLQNFNTTEIQKLAVRIKPSNFKKYLLNNLNNGKIEKILLDLKFNKDLKITDYKINGSIKKINIKLSDDFSIHNVNLNFISDKNLTLINSISASYQGISISNGSLSIKTNKEISIEGKLNSKFNFKKNTKNKLLSKLNLNFLEKNRIKLQGSLLNKFTLKISENFKLIDYDYQSSGNILESQIVLKNYFKTSLIDRLIKKISVSKTNLEINLSKKKKNFLTIGGFYNLGGVVNKKFNVTYDLNKKKSKHFIDFDLPENIFLKTINFRTNHKNQSNIKSEINFINNNIVFKNINFTEGKNSIYINNLKLNKKNEIESISDIGVLTFINNKENNNFKITFKK